MSMTQDQVQKIESIVTKAKDAALSVLALLAESGAGGHLNESQIGGVIAGIAGLATIGLEAYGKAAGVEITPETVLALLPAPITLVEPTVSETPTTETPVATDKTETPQPSAADLDAAAAELKAADATSGTVV